MTEIKENKIITDIVVERVVLASAIASYAHFMNVLSFVTEEDFFIPFNKLLFRACFSVYKQEVEVIDKLTLVNEILAMFAAKSSDPAIKQCIEDGVSTVANVNLQIESLYAVQESFDFANIALYVKRLLNTSKKNKLLNYLSNKIKKVEDTLVDHSTASMDLVNEIELGVLELMQNADASDEPEDIFSDMDSYIEKVLTAPVDMVGLSTGNPILDDRLDGLVNGTLNVIAAYKKGGKSCLCMNISLHVAFKLGIPVLYIDTEMSTDQARSRIMSRLTRIPEKRIKRGQLSEKEREVVVLAARALKEKGKYFHKYMPGFTVEAVTAMIKKYHSKYNIGLVVFDYIKAGAQEDFGSVKEYQLLGNTTIALKDLSGILDIPILTAVQRGRGGDIADSDRIARYADTVTFFEEKTKEEIDKLGFAGGLHKFVIKHSRRGGETPDEGVGVHFRKSILSIQEANEQLIDYKECEVREEDLDDMKDNLVQEEKIKREKERVKEDKNEMDGVADLW